MSDARVSFIPRGETLAEGFDKNYERKTDAARPGQLHPEDRQLLPGRGSPQGSRDRERPSTSRSPIPPR